MSEPTPSAAASRPVIEVAGRQLTEAVAAALRSATVDTDADGPDACRLVFDDPNRTLLSGSGFDLAAELVLIAGRVGDDTGERLFDGVVYALGFDYDDRGAWTTVSAYDRSYALYNGVQTKTYQNVTDSDLARQIAQAVGLTVGTIDATSVVHDHVSQVNETYVQFLGRRAAEVGRIVRVVGSRLDFVTSTPAASSPQPGDFDSTDRLQLVSGGNVQRMTVRVSAAQQVKEVEVRGWDPAGKTELVSTAAAGTTRAHLRDTPGSLAQTFGDPRHVDVDVPLSQQAACDALAAARAEHLASAHVHAEGIAYGDPRIVADAAVSLGASGGRFDGQVTISRATHTWDARGYRTAFVASGGHDRSMLGLIAGEPGKGARRRLDRISGLVVGLVTNVTDPENQTRVKVRFPWLDNAYESDWARLLQLGAGAGRGLQLVPEVGDEVLVGFDQGDPRRPYVLGGLFNGVDAPPRDDAVDAASGTVVARIWRTRVGHEIVLDDTEGAGKVVVRTADGKSSLELAADGKITITAEGDVLAKTTGKLTLQSDGDLALEAKGAGSFKATGKLTLSGDGNVEVKGPTIKLN